MREKYVELHTSGNGYKILATCLKMSISIVRTMIKNVKAAGTVTNLKRTHVYFAPTHSEEDDKRGKKFLRISVGVLQRKVGSWGHQVLPEKKAFSSHCW